MKKANGNSMRGAGRYTSGGIMDRPERRPPAEVVGKTVRRNGAVFSAFALGLTAKK